MSMISLKAQLRSRHIYRLKLQRLWTLQSWQCSCRCLRSMLRKIKKARITSQYLVTLMKVDHMVVKALKTSLQVLEPSQLDLLMALRSTIPMPIRVLNQNRNPELERLKRISLLTSTVPTKVVQLPSILTLEEAAHFPNHLPSQLRLNHLKPNLKPFYPPQTWLTFSTC